MNKTHTTCRQRLCPQLLSRDVEPVMNYVSTHAINPYARAYIHKPLHLSLQETTEHSALQPQSLNRICVNACVNVLHVYQCVCVPRTFPIVACGLNPNNPCWNFQIEGRDGFLFVFFFGVGCSVQERPPHVRS
jgi:hypothetical protein